MFCQFLGLLRGADPAAGGDAGLDGPPGRGGLPSTPVRRFTKGLRCCKGGDLLEGAHFVERRFIFRVPIQKKTQEVYLCENSKKF